LAKIAALILLLICIACSTPSQPPQLFYSVPTVSYLRETPNYDSEVVTELYASDQVKPLNKSNGWWQVQSLRNDKIGWTQRDLLSETPLAANHYYIVADGLPLRNAPNEDVMSRNFLSAGDLVQKIGQKDGWWRVLVEKDKAIGWIPAKMASETRPEPPGSTVPSRNSSEQEKQASSLTQPLPHPDHYYVAAETLPLYIIPLMNSQVVKLLVLNSKVEKIAQHGSDWVKIRYLDTGAEGWTQTRYLKAAPVTKKSQIVTTGKKSRKKSQLRKSLSKEPSESKILEPEGM
jgi:uncharacterized protein YgiM (DUF1202 family)